MGTSAGDRILGGCTACSVAEACQGKDADGGPSVCTRRLVCTAFFKFKEASFQI